MAFFQSECMYITRTRFEGGLAGGGVNEEAFSLCKGQN